MAKNTTFCVFIHNNHKQFFESLNALIAQANKEETLMAIFPELGAVALDRLTLEMGNILDTNGFIMELLDETTLH
jgi:hypothetical protein